MSMNRSYFANLNRPSFPFQGDEEVGEVCIANISPLERRKRLRFAIGQLVFTLMVLGVLIALNVDPRWRLLLFFPFSASAVGYFQARDKT